MPQKPNKSDLAYDALEGMITFQELAPGAMISESILMQLTDLGRTPVREALQRLARERMVEIYPNRGVFVAPTSIEAQLKLLELRRTVEELAVRWAASRADTQQREAMLQLATDLEESDHENVKEFGKLLKRTHELIVTAADNEYLQVAMTPLQGLSKRFWFAHLREPRREVRTAAGLHASILRAVCHGNESQAGEASHRLNDYLVDFAYQTLEAREVTRSVRSRQVG